MGEGPATPRVVARLPFFENGSPRLEKLSAFAVARVDQEASGEDVSLFAIEADGELSRARLREVFTAVGLAAVDFAVWNDQDDQSLRLHLVEVRSFIVAGDERLAAIHRGAGKALRHIIGLGGYALPLNTPRSTGDG